MLNLLTVI